MATNEKIESRLMSHVYALELLKSEFMEIISAEEPATDRAVKAAALFARATEDFGSFIACVKDDIAHLVPAAKDEFQVGKIRVRHTITENKKLDQERWAEAVGASEELARIEQASTQAAAALRKARLPYMLPSYGIEIKEVK
jgi:hypothetical protein